MTAKDQQVTVSTVAPTQTMQKSFLLTYRMFCQGSEHIRLIDPNKPISPELLDPSLSQQWLGQVQDVAQKLHAYLRELPSGQITFNLVDPNGNVKVETPTRWEVLEVLLYGYFSHVTQRKRLNNWLSTPFRPLVEGMLMAEFRDILLRTLRAILHLAHYARIELGLPQSQ
jgi:hypothetical protein